MTPEEERQQFRDVFSLKEKVKRLEEEGWDRDKRLHRAEQRIFSLANGLSMLGGAVLWGALAYAVSRYGNSWWEWLGIALLALITFFVVREAIQRFYKD